MTLRGMPVGYYGKLPARADFVSRRLGRFMIERWDNWLQQCLPRSEAALGLAWESRYLTAPAWRFALPARVCGENALIGVMVPSADSVGRCFPLLVAQELPVTVDPVTAAVSATAWFEAAETLALDALDGGFDLTGLDRTLPIMGLPVASQAPRGPATAYPVGMWIGLPMLSALGAIVRKAVGIGPRSALWWTSGGGSFPPSVAVTSGLIPPAGFAALLDGAWARHGWHGAPEEAPDDPEPAWDREA
jgi:type VI secretion system protein ImpM